MLSNFFYVFKYILLSVLIGVIMIAVGMIPNLGKIGIYVQPILVGAGSATIAFGILRQFSVLKEDGFFDNISFKDKFNRKYKKSTITNKKKMKENKEVVVKK